MRTVPESMFTEPTYACPHPERWAAWDGQSAEVEVVRLVSAFVSALKPEIVVETGTAAGYTAFAIGTTLLDNGFGHLHTLEIDPVVVDDARERLRGLPVTVHHADSMEWEPPDAVQFAWFDSLTHLRSAEFMRYSPKIARGAIVGFHDTGGQHPTRNYIDVLTSARLIRPIYLPTPRGVCFAEVL